MHGLGATSPAYFAQASTHPLLTGRRSLLVDLLGHGISDVGRLPHVRLRGLTVPAAGRFAGRVEMFRPHGTTSHASTASAQHVSRGRRRRLLPGCTPCGTTPSLPADLVSAARHFYHGATSLTTAPLVGDVTRLDEQDAEGTGCLTTATHTYDTHGREQTSTYDPVRGVVTATVDPNGKRTDAVHDGLGRVLKVWQPG